MMLSTGVAIECQADRIRAFDEWTRWVKSGIEAASRPKFRPPAYPPKPAIDNSLTIEVTIERAAPTNPHPCPR